MHVAQALNYLIVSCRLWLTDYMVWGWQLASAAVMAGADGAAELAALEAGGGVRDTAVATAVYDCHYRPYTQRQARTDRTRARTYKSAKWLSRGCAELGILQDLHASAHRAAQHNRT